ncbi:MAG TPA: autotransporter-associated beta strand repeat-containing protein [Chthoniobacteraceae bacterium]|nr:autotransporter-associated beta strand repeat-containing protein [Chthoniobacteraceae bacterium]
MAFSPFANRAKNFLIVGLSTATLLFSTAASPAARTIQSLFGAGWYPEDGEWAPPDHYDETEWDGSGTGGLPWSNKDYWDDGSPKPNDLVLVNKILNYPVLEGEGGPISIIEVAEVSALLIGHGDGKVAVHRYAQLTISGGSLELGYGNSDSYGSLEVSGDQAKLNVNGDIFLLGDRGNGRFDLSNGATAEVAASANFYLGASAGGYGNALIGGAGTGLTVKSRTYLGGVGEGTLQVENGATATFEQDIFVGTASTSEGTLIINNATLHAEANLDIGAFGTATANAVSNAKVTIDDTTTLGADASGTGELKINGTGTTWKSKGMTVGLLGKGTLHISNGGQLITEASANIALHGGSGGSSVTVDGTGSRWDIGTNPGDGPRDLGIGGQDDGYLTIKDGGQVDVAGVVNLGNISGSGTVTVTGAGSRLESGGLLQVGQNGFGQMTVSDGAEVVTDTFAAIAAFNGSGGSSATVTGTGSKWSIGTYLSVGRYSEGTLVVENGGFVSSAETTLGVEEGSSGTLRLNGSDDAAPKRGTFATKTITKGEGEGAIEFDGGILRATENAADFISNFETGDLRIASGGAFLDTQTFTVGVSAVLQGEGGLHKLGAGVLELSGANTYTGLTEIAGGTLKLNATGSIDGTSGISLGTDGTFDVRDKIGGYTVENFSGSGTITGALTVSDTLSIGNSPGTAGFDDLTLDSTTTFTFELTGGGTEADLGNVAGLLDLGGATLNLVQLGDYTAGDKFTLFSYNEGNLTGLFNGLANGAIFEGAGGEWQIDYSDTLAGFNGGSGDRFVTIRAIPEPGVALLGCLGAALLLWRRRRA